MNNTFSKTRLLIGNIIKWIIGLFLLWDAFGKVFKLSYSIEGTTELGYGEGMVLPLGIILLIITILYLIPKTSIKGAILLTGFLGGAVATHILSGIGWFWFPMMIAALAWIGLWLQDKRLEKIATL